MEERLKYYCRYCGVELRYRKDEIFVNGIWVGVATTGYADNPFNCGKTYVPVYHEPRV